jgi:lipoate-protein ligase A
LGNLNFSLVVSTRGQAFNDFRSFTLPVIDTLAHYGIAAELSSRNDITIEGQKFSGNAQYRTHTHLLHHGTILFDSDLDVVGQALNVRQDKIASKGIKSVRSRVTNVKPHLPAGVTLQQFSTTLQDIIGEHNHGLQPE